MRRGPLIALLAIFATALAVRVAYVASVGHALTLLTIGADVAHNIVAHGRWFVNNIRADEYLGWLSKRAGRIVDPGSVDLSGVDRHGLWYPEVDHPVGTSVVTAGLWALSGSERYVQIELLQALLDSLAALLVYWIALQLFKRRRAALMAAMAYALYPPLAWQAINPYDDIWAVDFTLALLAAYLLFMRSGRRARWLVLAGLMAGVGAYFRPQTLLIVPVLTLATLGRTGWREATRATIVTSLTAVLVLVPWTIRNYEQFHAFVPIRSGLWETMVSGLNELPTPLVHEAEADIARAHPGIIPESTQWHAAMKPFFVEAVEHHPLFYLEVLAHRVALATVLVNETRWMRRGAGSVFRERGGVASVVVGHPLAMLEYALPNLVFLLAMLAAGLMWRRWREPNRILTAVVLCTVLPYLALHVEERYLLPAFAVYFIWIGLGVDLLLGRIKRDASPSSDGTSLPSPSRHSASVPAVRS